VFLVACTRPGGSETPPERRGDDPCAPTSLAGAAARLAEPWTPPQGCTYRGGIAILASADDARAAFDCDPATLGFDFGTHALVVLADTMSPAQTGLYALDDGSKVTVVRRSRNPCPDDPHPMPVPVTNMFRIPAGTRTMADAVCTVDTKCR
jgi:hypothetical protein